MRNRSGERYARQAEQRMQMEAMALRAEQAELKKKTDREKERTSLMQMRSLRARYSSGFLDNQERSPTLG